MNRSSTRPGLLGLVVLAVIACLLFAPLINQYRTSSEGRSATQTAAALMAQKILPTKTATPVISATPTRTLTPTQTVTVTPTATSTMVYTLVVSSPTPTQTSTLQPCAYMWGNQPLPGQTAQLQSAINAAGFNGATARAAAYGENCVAADGTSQGFSTMQTDLYFELPAENLDDKEAMGQQLHKLMGVLMDLPDGTFPRAVGYVGPSFTQDGQTLNLWFKYDDAVQAYKAGLNGEALFTRLRPES